MDTPVSLLDQLQKQPNDTAWQRLVDLYTPFLHNWLRAQGKIQASDVDDIVQEILKTLMLELPKFAHNGRPGAFRKWLSQIARNRTLALMRARKRDLTDDQLDRLVGKDGEVDAYFDREHDRHLLDRLLTLIEPEFASSAIRAFRLLAVEGMPAKNVAEQMKMTTNALRIVKCRILARLREEIRGLVDES